MIGAELGYHYFGSPLIWPEAGDGPPYDFVQYTPSTWPGVRLPHVWLADGTALQDRIGNQNRYVLLRLGGSRQDASALDRAFAALGAPFAVLDVPDARVRDLYGHDLLLLRPDLHVAWRGNQGPEEPERLARVVTGHEV
jgi:hypothetical protein